MVEERTMKGAMNYAKSSSVKQLGKSPTESLLLFFFLKCLMAAFITFSHPCNHQKLTPNSLQISIRKQRNRSSSKDFTFLGVTEVE